MIEGFLEMLRQTPRHWLLLGPSLRLGKYNCPISSVTGCPHDFANPIVAAVTKLGLSQHEAEAIYVSADNLTWHRSFDPELRARLLEACGILPRKEMTMKVLELVGADHGAA